MRTVSKTVNPGSNPGSPALERPASIRLIAGLTLALLLTLVELIDQVRPWSSGPFSSPGPIAVVSLVASLGAGAIIARGLALLALIPPLGFLVCLEVAGYTSSHQDGSAPLAFRSFFLLTIFGLCIMLGVLLGRMRPDRNAL